MDHSPTIIEGLRIKILHRLQMSVNILLNYYINNSLQFKQFELLELLLNIFIKFLIVLLFQLLIILKFTIF